MFREARETERERKKGNTIGRGKDHHTKAMKLLNSQNNPNYSVCDEAFR